MANINDPEHDGRIPANDNARENAYEALNEAVFGEKLTTLREAAANKTRAMPQADIDHRLLSLLGIHYDFKTDAMEWESLKEKLEAMLPKGQTELLEHAKEIHVLNHAARIYEDTLGENSEHKKNAPQAREALVTCIKSYGNPFQANEIVDQFTQQIEQQKAAGATLE